MKSKANGYLLKAKLYIEKYITEEDKTGADEKDTGRELSDSVVNILADQSATLKWYFLDQCEKHLKEMELDI